MRILEDKSRLLPEIPPDKLFQSIIDEWKGYILVAVDNTYKFHKDDTFLEKDDLASIVHANIYFACSAGRIQNANDPRGYVTRVIKYSLRNAIRFSTSNTDSLLTGAKPIFAPLNEHEDFTLLDILFDKTAEQEELDRLLLCCQSRAEEVIKKMSLPQYERGVYRINPSQVNMYDLMHVIYDTDICAKDAVSALSKGYLLRELIGAGLDFKDINGLVRSGLLIGQEVIGVCLDLARGCAPHIQKATARRTYLLSTIILPRLKLDEATPIKVLRVIAAEFPEFIQQYAVTKIPTYEKVRADVISITRNPEKYLDESARELFTNCPPLKKTIESKLMANERRDNLKNLLDKEKIDVFAITPGQVRQLLDTKYANMKRSWYPDKSICAYKEQIRKDLNYIKKSRALGHITQYEAKQQRLYALAQLIWRGGGLKEVTSPKLFKIISLEECTALNKSYARKGKPLLRRIKEDLSILRANPAKYGLEEKVEETTAQYVA